MTLQQKKEENMENKFTLLMKAAPDMLEALQYTMDVFRLLTAQEFADGGMELIRNKITETISKAFGE